MIEIDDMLKISYHIDTVFGLNMIGKPVASVGLKHGRLLVQRDAMGYWCFNSLEEYKFNTSKPRTSIS